MSGETRSLAALIDPVADAAERDEWKTYLRYHARRYGALMRAVTDCVAGASPRILNVGPMFETTILRERVPGAHVDTLGFAHPLFPPRAGERHIQVDLNEADAPGAPPPDASYDALVMAEVIEHLHTAPALVLGYLAGWLRPGGTLVLQTPNAIALHKRLRMLLGKNPHEPLRENRQNPGHFHEYTVAELKDVAARVGLEVSGVRTANYFGAGTGARVYEAVGRILPPSLRHGITICLRTPPGAGG